MALLLMSTVKGHPLTRTATVTCAVVVSCAVGIVILVDLLPILSLGGGCLEAGAAGAVG